MNNTQIKYSNLSFESVVDDSISAPSFPKVNDFCPRISLLFISGDFLPWLSNQRRLSGDRTLLGVHLKFENLKLEVIQLGSQKLIVYIKQNKKSSVTSRRSLKFVKTVIKNGQQNEWKKKVSFGYSPNFGEYITSYFRKLFTFVFRILVPQRELLEIWREAVHQGCAFLVISKFLQYFRHNNWRIWMGRTCGNKSIPIVFNTQNE